MIKWVGEAQSFRTFNEGRGLIEVAGELVNGVHRPLKRMNLLITKRCNLRCKMCDHPLKRVPYQDLSLEQLKQVIREAAQLGVEAVDLTGGEPMLRDDIYEMIACAKSVGMDVVLVTNGTLIKEREAQKLVAAGLRSVVISLEGVEVVNDRIRGRGNYQKAVHALQCFLKFKERLGDIKAGVTISNLNFRQLYDFTRFLFEEVGINAISYNPFTRYMLTPSHFKAAESFEIPPDQLDLLREELDKIIAYSGQGLGSFPDPRYLKKIPDYFAGASMLPAQGCSLPLQSCAVDSHGAVYACLKEMAEAGNVTRTSLPEIIAGEVYQKSCQRALRRECGGCLSSCYEELHSG